MLTGIITAIIIVWIFVVLDVDYSANVDNDKLTIFEENYQYNNSNNSTTPFIDNKSYIKNNTKELDYETKDININNANNNTQDDVDSKNQERYEAKKDAILIDSFTIITPKSTHLCSASNPWKNGFDEISNNSVISSKTCFAFKITAYKTSEIYLLSQSENGNLIKLFPNNCNGLRTLNSRLKRFEEIILPQDELGKHLILSTDNEGGKEWFYSIALSSVKSRNALISLINKIPGLCIKNTEYSIKVSVFKRKLQKIQQDNYNDFHWISKSIN